ncbi:beta-lactamase family protein [Sphingomonas sp. R-74633]|uniref:serine hydrolase domain-containing protein n=1 Tax=Sphingomonas sp. R-74633 TaxID=2751188 RepID=UPI0015D4466F|nr:serine hydrolase domain-containing protein [Sphingomonas sp. R-74633]NYT43033.1 beta-lactamase family protein [Sphingomonas sp. R-74633]
MRVPVLLTLLLGAPFPTLAQTASAPPANAEQHTVQQRIEAVISGLRGAVAIKGAPPATRTLSDEMTAKHVPGVAIAVIKGGKVDWARGFGTTRDGGEPVTADTLFQAGSVSKPVAAVTALALVQDGSLSLDTNVNATLKSWKLPENGFTATTPVTLRALLSHTAGTTVHGFWGYDAGSPVPTLTQVLRGAAPANSDPVLVDQAVGSAFRYSGGGYLVMQQMAIDATGKSFPALVRAKLFEPLGMTRSSEDQPLDAARLAKGTAWPHDLKGVAVAGGPHVHPETAAAGLWTTAPELARFVTDLRAAAIGEKGHVLTPETARLMLTPVKDDFGLGLWVQGATAEKYFYHDGSNAGYKAVFLSYLQSGDGVVVLTNGDGGSQLGEEILRAVAVEYGWPDYQPVERATVVMPVAEQEKFIGTFKVEWPGEFIIRRDGDQLVAEIRKVVEPLLPDSANSFFLASRGMQLSFSDPDHGFLTLGDYKGAFERTSAK